MPPFRDSYDFHGFSDEVDGVNDDRYDSSREIAMSGTTSKSSSISSTTSSDGLAEKSLANPDFSYPASLQNGNNTQQPVNRPIFHEAPIQPQNVPVLNTKTQHAQQCYVPKLQSSHKTVVDELHSLFVEENFDAIRSACARQLIKPEVSWYLAFACRSYLLHCPDHDNQHDVAHAVSLSRELSEHRSSYACEEARRQWELCCDVTLRIQAITGAPPEPQSIVPANAQAAVPQTQGAQLRRLYSQLPTTAILLQPTATHPVSTAAQEAQAHEALRVIKRSRTKVLSQDNGLRRAAETVPEVEMRSRRYRTVEAAEIGLLSRVATQLRRDNNSPAAMHAQAARSRIRICQARQTGKDNDKGLCRRRVVLSDVRDRIANGDEELINDMTDGCDLRGIRIT